MEIPRSIKSKYYCKLFENGLQFEEIFGSAHLWWKGIYQASVDKELERVLDEILLS
ncbi:MAG: hypothetical protein QXL91_01615 [Candidatus Bathyarchaeia archaeon]|nr:hypothetical protein [Candidatus Bathyarchaeota archaeon]